MSEKVVIKKLARDNLRDVFGDKLRTGVDLGVDRGVEPADKSPCGFVKSGSLKTFSLPSGTEI